MVRSGVTSFVDMDITLDSILKPGQISVYGQQGRYKQLTDGF